MVFESRFFSVLDYQFQVAKYLLLLASLCFAYLGIKKRKKLVKTMEKIPGPKSHFFIGNLSILGIFNSTGDKHKDLEQLLLRFQGLSVLFKNGVVRLWVFGWSFICVFKYHTVEAILGNPLLGEKTPEYKFFEPIMGKGLITSSFHKNKKRRKLIIPALSIKLQHYYLETFNYHAKMMVEKIFETLDREYINVIKIFSLFALDIVCETAMGVRLNSQNEGESEYSKAVNEVDRMVLERGVRPWLWPDFLFYQSQMGKRFKRNLEIVDEFTIKVINMQKKRVAKELAERERCREGESEKSLPFIDILLQEHIRNPDFTFGDVKEEVDTLMGAGFDTMTMSCSWALFLIGQHPEVQQKIFDELLEVFGDDVDRIVTMEDIKKLKYMECVIKECHRLYPPVPLIGKKITEDIIVDGYKVPKGVTCYILVLALQRDPEVFPNPETFDPDRFLPENSAGRNPYSFIPFSAGVRACIGKKYALIEEKTTLAYIFRNFCVKSLDARDKVVVYTDIVLRTNSEIRIKFHPRILK